MPLPIDEFIDNNYFNSYFVEYEMPKYFQGGEPETAFENIKAMYHALDLADLTEAQLEEEFIKKVLENLGYSFAYQVNKKVFGKNYKPDFALFESEEIKNAHYKDDKASNENILAICESKAYKVVLDNKKTNEDNPHFQLLRYLNDLKINYGFLTNGRLWRFYDVKIQNKDKIFYQIDLQWIIEKNQIEAFHYFYYIFHKNHLLQLVKPLPETQQANFEELSKGYILQVENDLKELIYGDDSIIEKIGQNLFAKYQHQYSTREIYANSLFFAFRLLFIAYFENKFSFLLFEQHKNYKRYSLRSILKKLESKQFDNEDFEAWNDLKTLFQYLDKGNPDLRIPLLNGGLFAPEKAPLLLMPFILNNQELYQILSLLLYHQNSKTWRDFKTLSVTHIGNIYEGLLESEFRQAFEGTYYLEYKQGKTEYEGYFDSYDYQRLKNDKKVSLLKEKLYESDEIYLSNKSNTRKTTASYYTPADITKFMVVEAIEKALVHKESILDIRILDNACGSGHFLIESLYVLTEKAIQRLLEGKDEKLKRTLQTERKIIEQSLVGVLKNIELDEYTLLRRILLKKIIFGVDLNSFAIELTRLSLWLDTFILGTPLSFIEHHIKQGNALIGGTKKELFDNLVDPNDLFATKLRDKIKNLIDQLAILSELKDSTAQEIEKSKQIYKNIEPALAQLNLAINFHTYRRFVPILFDKEKAKEKQIELQNALTGFEKAIFKGENHALIQEISETAQKFSFFNYEIEFAEVFQNGHAGFDMIIGNPPWDKTKFDDKDFFPMWRSSYRTMKQSEKEQVRITVLDYKGVKEEYEAKKDFITQSNEYFKAHYPYNAGVGDNNLFRFFIEHNLRLLAKNGSLTYVTPSAWIYEDSSLTLRKHIFKNYHLHFFYQFENRKGIFPDVDSRYKFAIFQITNKDIPLLREVEYPTLPVRFMQTDTDILYRNGGKDEILHYPMADIAGLSPEHWALFEVRTAQDLEIIRKCYQKFEPISPEFIDFRNEIHMTADRDIFKEEPNDLVLYEGKMIHQFDSKFGEAQYWINKEDFENRLIDTEISRLVSDIYPQIPIKNGKDNQRAFVMKYLDLSYEDLRKAVVFDTEFPRLIFRAIAGGTNERTLISTILPPHQTFGHSMFAHIPKQYVLEDKNIVIQPISLERVLFVNAVFNSIVVDFLIRFLVDMNVVKSIVMRLPIPQPIDAELFENEVYQKLIINAWKLNVVNNPELEKRIKLSKSLILSENLAKTNLPKTDKQKVFLQIEIDCLVAQLYGITHEELTHLTSPTYFKVLNEKNKAYVSALLETYLTYQQTR
ncbi:MAG: Eco57I restriction-modification methylase domain-containing protein [Thermoflexibacter sp.]